MHVFVSLLCMSIAFLTCINALQSRLLAPGYSLSLDGELDFYRMTSSKFSPGTKNVTIALWFQLDLTREMLAQESFHGMHVFGHAHGHNGPRITVIRRNGEFRLRTVHRKYGALQKCNGPHDYLQRPTLENKKWYHVAIVSDASEVKYYINSNIVGKCTVERQMQTETSELQHSASVHLGMYNFKETGQKMAFKGNVDELVYLTYGINIMQMKKISEGYIHKSIPSSNVLIHSSFEKNMENKAYKESIDMQWISVEGRKPKWERSEARVFGTLIVQQTSLTEKGVAPELLRADLMVHSQVHNKPPTYSINIIPKENMCDGVYHSTTSHYSTWKGGDEGFADVNSTTFPVLNEITALFFQPVADCVGSNLLSVVTMYAPDIFGDRSPDSKVSIVFEVLMNQAPVAGKMGGALSCDGINDYLYNANFSWPMQTYGNRTGGGPVTVQFWAKSSSIGSHDGSILSIGNCEEASNGIEMRNPFAMCGLFVLRAPNQVGEFEANVGSSRLAHDISDREGLWTDFTMTHDQASGTSAKLYINGELVNEITHDYKGLGSKGKHREISIRPFNPQVLGLTVCTWTFWSDNYYKGLIDELRIWNRTLSAEEIRSNMYVVLPAPMDGLMAYYTFDDEITNGIVKDMSGNNHHLYSGGCAPCEYPYRGYSPYLNPANNCQCTPAVNESCVAGDDIKPHLTSHCGRQRCRPSATSVSSSAYIETLIFGGHPCYYTHEEKTISKHLTRIASERWPSRLDSKAPISSLEVDETVDVVKGKITLFVTDPDEGDIGSLVISIIRLPQNGKLSRCDDEEGNEEKVEIVEETQLHAGEYSIMYAPNKGFSGQRVDSFSYKVSDGFMDSSISTVYISVPCQKGSFFNVTRDVTAGAFAHCTLCPPGTSNNKVSLKASCTPCEGHTFQSEYGETSCRNCPEGTFVNSNHSFCDTCPTSHTVHHLVQKVHEEGCPAILNMSLSNDVVLQIDESLNSRYMNLKLTNFTVSQAAFITSLPSQGVLHQFAGFHENGNTPILGAPIVRKGGEMFGVFPTRVLNTCGYDIPLDQQKNTTKFGIINGRSSHEYGDFDSSKAWDYCHRPQKFAYRQNSITLQLPIKMIVASIVLYENFRPGGVTSIEALEDKATQKWSLLWSCAPHSTEKATEYRIFQLSEICPNNVLSDTIRITTTTIDTERASQIDTVKFSGFGDVSGMNSGTTISDEELRFVYTPIANSENTDVFINYMFRRCTCNTKAEQSSQVRVKLMGNLTGNHSGQKDEQESYVALVCTFLPLVVMMLIFMVLHNIQQRRKRQALQNKLESAKRQIPQSALLDPSEVELQHEIGRGAGGVVYLGRFRGMEVALKQLTSIGIDSLEAAKEGVEVEARRMCELRHPNIGTLLKQMFTIRCI